MHTFHDDSHNYKTLEFNASTTNKGRIVAVKQSFYEDIVLVLAGGELVEVDWHGEVRRR
jgi:hypothetical protein